MENSCVLILKVSQKHACIFECLIIIISIENIIYLHINIRDRNIIKQL